MLSFVFKRKMFRIQETAFCGLSELFIERADVAYLHSNDTGEKIIPKGGIIQLQYTLITDLNQSKEELLSLIKKNCKYEIRRAEREGAIETIKKGTEIDDVAISQFKDTYNRMFKNKNLLDYTFNWNLVNSARRSNNLVVSHCTNSCGENDIYHAYLCDGTNCVLMYSASSLWNSKEKDKAKQIGMMNKYLHWKDMMYFKDKGYDVYEWGGISSIYEPNGIDRFKMEFGGKAVQYNNYIIPKTALGHLYSYLVRRRRHE